MDTEYSPGMEIEPEEVPTGTPDDVNDGALEEGPPEEANPTHTEERIQKVLGGDDQ